MVYPRLAPDDSNQQFRPGMKIWVTLPTGTYQGTLIRTFGSGGRTSEIQLDNGQIVTVDVNPAGTGTPPGSPILHIIHLPIHLHIHHSLIRHDHTHLSHILTDNFLVSRAYQE